VDPFLTAFGKSLFDLRGRFPAKTKLFGKIKMELDISDKTQRSVFSQKCYETGFSRYIISLLKHGDVFVDIGANAGYFTVLSASLVGEKGRVLAVEPELKNFNSLKRNVEINHYKNVILHRGALGSSSGSLTLHINPLNHGGNSLLPFDRYKSGNKLFTKEEIASRFGSSQLSEKVSVTTLDSLIEKHQIQKIAIMKIDVEGFEKGVLLGAKKVLSSGIVQNVMCEVNNNETRQEVFDLFKKNGYQPHRLLFAGKPEKISSDTDIARLHGNILFVKTEGKAR